MHCRPLTGITEVFAHGAPGVWSQVLERSCVRSSSGHNCGVFHGTTVSQSLYKLGYCRSLLANSDVDTVQLLFLVISLVEEPLVDDSVDSNSCFT